MLRLCSSENVRIFYTFFKLLSGPVNFSYFSFMRTLFYGAPYPSAPTFQTSFPFFTTCSRHTFPFCAVYKLQSASFSSPSTDNDCIHWTAHSTSLCLRGATNLITTFTNTSRTLTLSLSPWISTLSTVVLLDHLFLQRLTVQLLVSQLSRSSVQTSLPFNTYQ